MSYQYSIEIKEIVNPIINIYLINDNTLLCHSNRYCLVLIDLSLKCVINKFEFPHVIYCFSPGLITKSGIMIRMVDSGYAIIADFGNNMYNISTD